MDYIKERGSTHVYHVNRMSKEEMDNMVGRCIHEEPAYCEAACPFKVDTKALLAHVAAGNIKKALAIYEKVTPFPIILATGCDAPCEEKCILCGHGEGIAVSEIERTVARCGGTDKKGSVFRIKKKKTVAIFGSGLFTLFLAGELEKKMYPTTVYCKESSKEEYISASAPHLATGDVEIEAKRLSKMDLDFVFDSNLTKDYLEEESKKYDIVCAAEDIAALLYPGETADPEVMVIPDRSLVTGSCKGVMEGALGAKKAAISVDRLAQNLSPYNNRGEEGPVETRLYTNTQGVEYGPRVPVGSGLDGYSEEEAEREAKRCIQCHCDECMRACVYLREYKKHPGLLGREIYNNTQIIMGDHPMNKPMNSCSLCGQCTVICPNGFDMSQICRMARENMVSTDKMPLAPHEFALMDMIFSNTEAFLSKSQPGFEKSKYVFFPGCQAGAIAPGVVEAAYLDLTERLAGGVGLMLGCCGAISDWAGRYEMTGEHREFLKNELARLGNPIIIAGCPSCRDQLKALESGEVVGIWDILCDIGLPKGAEGLKVPIAIHDACGARGDGDTREKVRRLLGDMGCSVTETELSGDKTPCCGYGGLTSYTNPELSKKMADFCVSHNDGPFVSYCMACRDRFARQGRESKHILELIYGTLASETPDINEKRYNRLKLAQRLLKNVWKEEICVEDKGYEVIYGEDTLSMMDERMILKSDVEKVLSMYRETGEAVLDGETQELVARSRLGNVTFWVRFVETEGGYEVRRAYSHRMNIEKRAGQ